MSDDYNIGDGGGCACPHCHKRLNYCGDALGEDEELESECRYCEQPIVWLPVHSFYWKIKKKEEEQ